MSSTVVINQCPQLVYTHTFPFIPNWYYLIIQNMYHTQLTLSNLQIESKDW